MQATARANSNIAFIKYWGNVDDDLRLPVNPSLSMNLEGLYTETRVRWDPDIASDEVMINGETAAIPAYERVVQHLDLIRKSLDLSLFAHVESHNTFPMGAGIASSASAFAALTMAATAAAGHTLPERELSVLARRGSGSASRSIPTGFVEWYAGVSSGTSYAESIAPPDHWALVDVIALISVEHKSVGSTRGHVSAQTSELQPARVAGAGERLDKVRQAILMRDFRSLADVVEHDSNLMHAVMITSRPPLFYWQPASLTVMDSVRNWRLDGLQVCYTLDAGPNVHCICTEGAVAEVESGLRAIPGVQDVLVARPGGGAVVLSAE
ncbi:MAG: diphosphomevalonate decarboxylase [Phototrophicaceae bacterium]